MTISANLKEAFDTLELHYGNHSAAAKAVGYGPEHYRKLRNGRSPVPDRVAIVILNKAAELASHKSPPAPEYETEAYL